MNKDELKKIIKEVVLEKINEAHQKNPKYGYVMKSTDAADDPSDPRLQLIGYGNMPKSFWKKKIEKYAEELLRRVKNDDWRAAAYFMEQKGVFNSAVNMMKEVSTEESASDDVKS